jgi:hypothetical protein
MRVANDKGTNWVVFTQTFEEKWVSPERVEYTLLSAVIPAIMNEITLGLGEAKRLHHPKMVLYICCVWLCM